MTLRTKRAEKNANNLGTFLLNIPIHKTQFFLRLKKDNDTVNRSNPTCIKSHNHIELQAAHVQTPSTTGEKTWLVSGAVSTVYMNGTYPR